MIHELDILDIVSYFVEQNPKIELKRPEIVSIKRDIETHFASIEVSVSHKSIDRFAQKYQNYVRIVSDTVTVNMDASAVREITRLRSPYMLDSIKQLLDKYKLK